MPDPTVSFAQENLSECKLSICFTISMEFTKSEYDAVLSAHAEDGGSEDAYIRCFKEPTSDEKSISIYCSVLHTPGNPPRVITRNEASQLEGHVVRFGIGPGTGHDLLAFIRSFFGMRKRTIAMCLPGVISRACGLEKMSDDPWESLFIGMAGVVPRALEEIVRHTGSRVDCIAGMQTNRWTFDAVLQCYTAGKRYIMRREARPGSELSGGRQYGTTGGSWKCVAEIDVTSMYPSIIVEYNLSPENFTLEEEGTLRVALDGNSRKVCGEAVHFRRGPACLPRMFGGMISRRRLAKVGDPILASSLKFIMNAIVGCLGSVWSQCYSPEIYSAITTLGVNIMRGACQVVSRTPGCDVVYGDTDSLFITTRGNPVKLVAGLNARYSHMRFRVASRFKTFTLFAPRRYAGILIDGRLVTIGVMTINTPPLVLEWLEARMRGKYAPENYMVGSRRYYTKVGHGKYAVSLAEPAGAIRQSGLPAAFCKRKR